MKMPPAELVDVKKLRVDGENANRMSARQFKALKKSIRRWGFIVPIITNRDYLVADGEHRLTAAKDMGMKQVSVVRLPVDDVDRRMIRQVMNKMALNTSARRMNWCSLENANKHRNVKSRRGHTKSGRGEVAW